MRDRHLNVKAAFPAICAAKGLPKPVTEYKFHPTRRWKIDYAWPAQKVALECEGGIWRQGRHTRGSGFKKDMEKYTEAAILGWTVIRIEVKELAYDSTFDKIRRALQKEER